MIKTHRMTPKNLSFDRETILAFCAICGEPGKYWSQDEGSNGKPLGKCINHCQRHRVHARKLALRKW